MNPRKTYLLVQLGTPDSLELRDIKSYLREFLMDPDTITLPYLLRYILVNGIIVPRRSKKVLKRYQLIWDAEKGSPLRHFSESLVFRLQQKFEETASVRLATLYGSPQLEEVLTDIMQNPPDELVIFPLFPHETPATTGVVEKRMNKFSGKKAGMPTMRWIPPFFQHPAFIRLFANRLLQAKPANYDHIVFSFHGLPLKQTTYDTRDPAVPDYQSACELTARRIADAANVPSDQIIISYQSRFGRKWTAPQTEDILRELSDRNKKVLLIAPSFTADCLETSWEIGISFRKEFFADKPDSFHWIPSLNDDPEWVNVIFDWLKNN